MHLGPFSLPFKLILLLVGLLALVVPSTNPSVGWVDEVLLLTGALLLHLRFRGLLLFIVILLRI